MSVNRYAGQCHTCKGHIPALGGKLIAVVGRRRRVPVHLVCGDSGEPRVIEYRAADGLLLGFQNTGGRCEDAPCCGCCS